MQLLQFFDSTILTSTGGHEARLVVIPKRSFAHQNGSIDAQKIMEYLGLKKLEPITGIQLAPAIAALVSDSIKETDRVQRLLNACKSAEGLLAEDIKFAEQMAFDRIVPFEQSPLDMESLGKLVISATGAGVGAYAGFVLADSTPLLLITVPAGMIIFGAAKGVADALEQGLRERLLKYLKGEEKKTPKKDSTT